jgi:uncharacterized protein YjdB
MKLISQVVFFAVMSPVLMVVNGCSSTLDNVGGGKQLVQSISIPSIENLSTGSLLTLSATVLPANVMDRSIQWSSSNSAVATVSGTGVVTGVKTGSATITATATDGSGVVSNGCVITVSQINAQSIHIPAALSVQVGGSAQLTTVIAPSNASTPSLSWQISDATIATITSSGVVAGIKPGTVTVKATATDGSGITSNQSTVTVTTSTVALKSIKVPISAVIVTGGEMLLWSVLAPTNASDTVLQWSSSNLAVATVDEAGDVSGVSDGTAAITATATDGSGVGSNQCTVQVITQPTSTKNNLGVNVGSALDYDTNRTFTDVMKTSRTWDDLTQNPLPTSSLDSNGWPLVDAGIVAWAGIGQMNGTYALSFSGQATVTAKWGNATISNQSYNVATNVTTAMLVDEDTDPSNTALLLQFTNTQRTATSAVGTGITNVSFMRPQVPGASTPYPSTTVFTSQFLSALTSFSTLRMMDFTATNANVASEWSERTQPADASQAIGNPAAPPLNIYGWQGRGAAWEYAILMANTTGKDLWINVPERATDDYVTKLAELVQYGSDGVNPYTSLQSSPVWPPLAKGLHVYVEFSNEVWNTIFLQATDNHNAAISEVNAGGSPLNFDNTTNDWYWAWRRIAKRGIEISRIFRTVAGDANMMTRIRPVLMSQENYSDGPLLQQMTLLMDYYDDPSEVSAPEAPNYIFYAAGGAGYYGSSDLSSVDAIFATMGTAHPDGNSFAVNMQQDADWTLATGLHRIAYEGGPDMPTTGNSTKDANQAAAWADARMTATVTAMQNTWSANAGELIVYYSLNGNYQWGFMSDVLEPTSPKMTAVNNLLQADQAVATYGAAIPGTLSSDNYNVPASWASGVLYGGVFSGRLWIGYSVAATTARTFSISLVTASVNGGEMEVFVDGAFIGTLTVAATGSTNSFVTTGTLTTQELAVGSHGIVIRNVTGTSTMQSVKVE